METKGWQRFGLRGAMGFQLPVSPSWRVSTHVSCSCLFPFYFWWDRQPQAQVALASSLGILPSHPVAKVKLTGSERQKAHGGALNGSGRSWGVSGGSESKPKGFRAGQENPTQRQPRVPHITCSQRGFSAGKQPSTCPGSCRPQGWGMPRCWGHPGVLGSASAWGQPLGS